MKELAKRDRLTRYMLPEVYYAKNKLAREEWDEIAETILGTEMLEKRECLCTSDTDENIKRNIADKECEFYQVNFRYKKIFELCRIIGVKNIYDIGCRTINQAFLLVDYSVQCYTGIMDGRFVLNHFRQKDYDDQNDTVFITEETPPPFCNGRISFIKGHYPENKPCVQENNIAVAAYSFTMYRDVNSIRCVSDALLNDFERFLFNVSTDSLGIWKNMGLGGVRFFPIGSQGFVFGTKNPSDIECLKQNYPYENGYFKTGIDNWVEHWVGRV